MRGPRYTYMPKGLALLEGQFQELHERLERTRSSSKTATVNREALQRLLNDYGVLHAHIEELGNVLRNPQPEGKKASDFARPIEASDGSDLI